MDRKLAAIEALDEVFDLNESYATFKNVKKLNKEEGK